MKSRTIYLLRRPACTLLSLVLVTLLLLGIASERQHLKGYSDFSFGMAEAEVRQRITVLSENRIPFLTTINFYSSKLPVKLTLAA